MCADFNYLKRLSLSGEDLDNGIIGFSSDSNYFYFSIDNKIKVFSISNEDSYSKSLGEKIISITSANVGSLFISTSKKTFEWNYLNDNLNIFFEFPNDAQPFCSTFKPNSETLVSARKDTLSLWSLRQKSEISRYQITFENSAESIRKIIFNPDGKTFFTSTNVNPLSGTIGRSLSEKLRINKPHALIKWSSQTGKPTHLLGDTVDMWSDLLSISQDGTTLIRSDYDGIKFYDIANDTPSVRTVIDDPEELDTLYSLQALPNGKSVLLGDLEGRIAIVTEKGEIKLIKYCFGDKEEAVEEIALNKQGTLISARSNTVSGDYSVAKIWRII
ncbi:hypothetical protein CWATWH0402_3598 [Crocosphaera watsonii WH 0402]|uniref:Uncharacterized protein n=1 Tax=Crocosphaera watsonii WH 0402 TaxID=1284629 RepID=T2JXU4_CROWT|nr:hypothetical protein [Crocosphaera watsonii]CCQ70628.1 hypothetical protein CWATWH0402_3598 [Crocosphaera watsonii WH 0402]